MAFSILLTNKDITNFENAIINSFLKSPLFNELNEAVKVNKWKCKTEIYRRGSIADKNYSSHIIITLLTSKGKVVKEKDEAPKEETKPINNENKPIINIDSESKIIDDNVISDDEFFDDFFNE